MSTRHTSTCALRLAAPLCHVTNGALTPEHVPDTGSGRPQKSERLWRTPLANTSRMLFVNRYGESEPCRGVGATLQMLLVRGCRASLPARNRTIQAEIHPPNSTASTSDAHPMRGHVTVRSVTCCWKWTSTYGTPDEMVANQVSNARRPVHVTKNLRPRSASRAVGDHGSRMAPSAHRNARSAGVSHYQDFVNPTAIMRPYGDALPPS